jgi:hypothetical protein
VTAPSVALGALAHTLGEGCVSWSGLVMATVLLGAASWTQLARERSLPFFVAWTTLGQAVVHGVLTATCHGTAAAAHGTAAVPRSSMLLAHALSVGVVSLLLRRADARVWAMARLARQLRTWLLTHQGLWRGLMPLVLVPVDRRPAPEAPVRVLRTSSRVQGRPARRGPPVGCCP